MPSEDRAKMIEVLKRNQGFVHPERWLDYAETHSFKLVRAEKLCACPDCGGRGNGIVGQYIYYSTLIVLRECDGCGLIYADVRIDAEVIRAHFEVAYKDEDYFIRRRKGIFDQLASLVSASSPYGGKVLDVGGAKGHLLATVRQLRKDLSLVLNDLSVTACDFGRAQYGLETICGGIDALESLSEQFDVVVLSDVIYYEPEIERLWSWLARVVSEKGTIVIRVPNHLPLIKLWSKIEQMVKSQRAREMRSQVRFFNPEHLYVFSKPYLARRLRGMGFLSVQVFPSALLGGGMDWHLTILEWMANICCTVSDGKVITTPSMVVVGRRGA